MTYRQCTVVRPKATFTAKMGKSRPATFKAGEELWVMTPEHAQKDFIMIGKKRWGLGCGYNFTLAQCEELFNFEERK